MSKEILKELKILFVEDEELIRKRVASSLRYIPDLIITDLKMPDMNGIELIKKVREKYKEICIIVLTAYTDQKYLVELINMHIEKFIVKPITLEKLITTILECEKAIKSSKSFLQKLPNGYKYDWSNKTLFQGKNLILLTKKEILFLELLLKNLKSVTSYKEIKHVVWQDKEMTNNALRSLVRNLRKKLPENFICNLSGVGYKIVKY